MAKRNKNYRKVADLVDRDHDYSPLEAMRLINKTTTKKFDETVDVVFRLGVDARKADQIVRRTVSLPPGTGKTARVLVFATGQRPHQALDAGADETGCDELTSPRA